MVSLKIWFGDLSKLNVYAHNLFQQAMQWIYSRIKIGNILNENDGWQLEFFPASHCGAKGQ